MKTELKYIGLCLILVPVLFLTACAREDAPPPPTATKPAAAAPTATRPPAAPTAAPEPTPVHPVIAVDDQVLEEDGRLTIASVISPDPAWLVIHAQHEGQVGEVLGVTAVPPGGGSDITVTLDPLGATPRLVAILHQDGGEAGQFEFPGPDDPILDNGDVVATGFAVDIRVRLPVIAIADQEVMDDGLVTVTSVYTPGPGWLLIHADDDGEIGPLLGHVFLRAGENENVTIPIQWREATPTLHAVLVADGERLTRLDYPDGDLPVIVNGQPLIASFAVTLPPDVFVLDQPVVDGKIEVERVISDGPGWLVVYFDENDLPARIIGSAPLADGLNEQVEVEVVERAATDKLHIIIHNDDEPVGEFNFPGADEPRLYHGRLPFSFTFQTNLGNYLVVRDQARGEGTAVTVPLVVADRPIWLVIRSGAAPGAGEIIGQIWLPAGINREVMVPIDGERINKTLFAVLHADEDEPAQFDFPGGADRPLEFNGRIIQSSFELLSPGE